MNKLIISNFRLNKELDAKRNSEVLIDFTKKFLEDHYLVSNLNCISKVTNVPINILKRV